MRRRFVLAIGLAWFCCAASMAIAYSFAPTSAHFTSAGRMSLSGGGFGADCATVFEGVTDGNGVGKITSAVFSGGLFGACGGLRAIGLPWTITAVDPGRALISAVDVRSPLIGNCGPGDVPVSVSDGGVIRFVHVALRPGCSVNGGALTTKPTVAILSR